MYIQRLYMTTFSWCIRLKKSKNMIQSCAHKVIQRCFNVNTTEKNSLWNTATTDAFVFQTWQPADSRSFTPHSFTQNSIDLMISSIFFIRWTGAPFINGHPGPLSPSFKITLSYPQLPFREEEPSKQKLSVCMIACLSVGKITLAQE